MGIGGCPTYWKSYVEKKIVPSGETRWAGSYSAECSGSLAARYLPGPTHLPRRGHDGGKAASRLSSAFISRQTQALESRVHTFSGVAQHYLQLIYT